MSSLGLFQSIDFTTNQLQTRLETAMFVWTWFGLYDCLSFSPSELTD